jgi:hypothetical protein
MSEHDDSVSRRYRSLAREEPPAALDASILAASRRALRKPSLSRRWAVPVSIAAVLVLGFGVALQMQREQPGIEYSEPAKSLSAPPPSPTAAPAPLADAPVEAPAKTPAAVDQAAPKPPERKLRKEVAPPKEAAPQAERDRSLLREKREAFTDSAAARPEPRPFSSPEPPRPAPLSPAAPALPPFTASKPVATTGIRGMSRDELQAAPETTPQSAASAPAPAARMRADTANSADRALSPEQELERIARLRADGRHDEADKAIEEFRRTYPVYRIPDAMWERIKRR